MTSETAEFQLETIKDYILLSIPQSCPSNVGLVETLSPGWGMRKQAISSKQDLMCFLTCNNSECCFGLVYDREMTETENKNYNG